MRKPEISNVASYACVKYSLLFIKLISLENWQTKGPLLFYTFNVAFVDAHCMATINSNDTILSKSCYNGVEENTLLL